MEERIEAVQIIRLPKHVPGDLDLASLNTRLRTGEACLDWTDVDADIAPQHLDMLFAGLNLADHIEAIGAATVPDAMMSALMTSFDRLKTIADADEQDEQEVLPTMTPAIWVPEVETDEAVEDTPPTVPGNMAAPMLPAPSPAALREELETMVLRDLLGPVGGEEEELDESRVRDRYLVGMLAPNELQTMPEEQDELASEEEGAQDDGPADTSVSHKASLSPSSIGMSFYVDKDATSLRVTVYWGQYHKEDSQTLKNAKGGPKKVWRRRQRGGPPETLQLKAGPIKAWQPEAEEQPDVFVKGVVRDAPGGWMVTLFLVNGQHEPKRLRDEAWLFQPELIVEAPDGGPIFQQRSSEHQKRLTPESRAMAMLYRRHISFAMGHGISVHAETLPGDPTSAVRLSTRVVPSHDIPLTEAPNITELPALASLGLDMQTLAEAPAGHIATLLYPLVTAYAAWIDEQEQRIDDPASGLQGYQETARETLHVCRRTLARIRAGIDMLASSAEAAHAFAFMNRAMWQQRLHTVYIEEMHKGGTRSLAELDQPGNRSWRPFQLAFILLNLPSLTDLHHPDRSTDPAAIADLLWFPTGGGKTEAYLGLTAYTLAIRRLQGTIEGRSGQDGVAVIMRYTLRLLTLQQFQRASSLICACELLRREDADTWGETPFRLGLWVGMHSTPNTTEASAQASKEEHGMYGSNVSGSGSPRQLTSCPWCGSAIDGGKHIEVESFSKGRSRTLVYCSDSYGQCPFSKAQASSEGLPVVVVDEEIYRLLPSLLIATVDKFAQLPWKGATQMLFGQVTKHCSRHGFRSPDLDRSDNHKDSHKPVGKWPAAISMPHMPLRPPDLIIQDELHLISGPLGTLVGLYETVVDHLATWTVDGKNVRPKVIAATATIRQAKEQIQALFLRNVNIFPPQGLDVEDNFFSRQRQPTDATPGRRYLGICANGRRQKAALIRVYVAHLSAAQVLYNKYGAAAADPWLTLVGYFNSMSELGGMRRLVEDDIRTRLRKMDERGLAVRKNLIVEELTSRKSSSAIPEVLNKLELSFTTQEGKKPLDVLLATNMISVGVDVKRLGLMVVTGQPKTTAEYIQATSRVGRSHPGLVCVVFHWARPRDLSHYEQFEHYHATFYKQVEALSVTPFAPRALDRGLAGLLTSYVRLSGPEFSSNDAAIDVTDSTPYFAQAIEEITYRAGEITNDAEAVERVRSALQKLKHYWLKRVNDLPNLGYKKQKDGVTQALLKQPERGKWDLFTCLNSLRDVEPTVHLVLDERSLGEMEGEVQDEIVVEEGMKS